MISDNLTRKTVNFQRCTTVLALKISQTTALEDRRMRKDLQV